MSLYQLQKLIHHINRDSDHRDRYKKDSATFASRYELTDEEKEAVLRLDIRNLYILGVHPLLLRPFTLAHGISAADYADALSGLK